MKLFVDANVFIDIQRKRTNWKKSFAVVRAVLEGRHRGYISALTPVIVYFLRRPVTSEARARRQTLDVIDGFEIVDLTAELVNTAFQEKRIGDFEDAIQFHSAKSVAKTLVTRNKRDYRGVEDELEVLTPEEFLEKYGA
ncbi:MAG: type II toxin-antitoxin system VapC family toxin [Candidatus Bathyarchaeia archaeon]